MDTLLEEEGVGSFASSRGSSIPNIDISSFNIK
jgi:hypothetical protein